MTATWIGDHAKLNVLRVLALYLRWSPLEWGRWRVASLAVRLSPLLKETKWRRVVHARAGVRLRIDGSSQTGRILYATGEYEPATTSILEQLVRPGDTVIDVGANIGFFTVVAARLVGPGGRVLAFEPIPEVREKLVDNVQVNGLSNVSIYAEALGAEDTSTVLYLGPSQDTGLSSLRSMEASTQLAIRQLRLDSLWKDDRPIRLIKIDVEGAEMAALHGMASCLSRHQPALVVEITEAFLRQMKSSAEEVRTFLSARGYSMYQILDSGGLSPVSSASDLARCPPQFNALFTVDEVSPVAKAGSST
jgi:FkbM family methyltransferase